ncbi:MULTISPECIES: PHP domain-containing protein [unclassified Holdemanella]|uniref:PHP domain-containing protein n=1 Tax=unclassified Holdemanella TaxID=2633909 RepID=UPI001D0B43F1|nr:MULTISPECIES: PHP domain-containing protein [unclassified Holdemanella]MCB8640041.1 PHP domain-containing protein [Holdemanella sp. DFI.5.55]MCG5648816.1 PHP domain-containing protein [Holdemanella sp. DFI.5.21]
MNKRYNNYHKHTHYSNISTLDVVVKPSDYIDRAKELGHTTYFTTEHGFQGNIFEAYKLCHEAGLKPIYGVEAYYVDDATVKETRENYHIVLIAMTNNARKQINKIISNAQTTGFYYKPRIDLNALLSLNPSEVVITSACIATRMFKKDDWKERFFEPVYKHFGKNFFLEVQDHNHPSQIELNKKILRLHKETGVQIIHGCDSHYIKPEDSNVRSQFLKAKGMKYGDEDSFILDYPSYDDILTRYAEQGVLTQEEAKEALDNTLVFDQAEEIQLDYEFKLPHIFDEDSNKHLKRLILQEFKRKIPIQSMSKEEIKRYKDALNYEYNIIKKCNMADYFILDYYIVKQAVEKYGAVLTRSGRGSAVSFLTNYILGFTQIDRLKSPIKLYPTRFMSAERILQTRSLPDIDLNWRDVKPVIQASKDYLGEDGVYYMVSYKPMQESSAFRLWCKSLDMNVKEYNDVAMNLDDYREDEKWKDLINDSKRFVGVIESVAPSPCSVLLLDKPISEEIGLIKVGDVTCCVLDGYYCDFYKYLKNDYLQVTVYALIDETYKLIGRPIDDIETLIANCDDKVWDLLARGITTTINQCDSDYDKQILSVYRPRNLAEASAYVASIRPGFASLLQNFIHRKPYTTGVQQLDDLLKDSFSYMMYQESIMTYLTWLGIEEKETYDIIKKISKKKFKHEELEELKKKLHEGWLKQVGKEDGFLETWEVVERASKYSFNASHSLSVALDALYGAYLKSHYPLEYFTVALTEYSGDEVRTNNLIEELGYFNITLSPIKFRYSTNDYRCDAKTHTIFKGIESIKFCNSKIADELYALRDNQYKSFIDLLIDITNHTSVDSRQLDILIKLDFFSEFGEPNDLLTQVQIFNAIYGKKTAKKNEGMVFIGDYSMSQERFNETVVKFDEYKETAKQIKGFDSISFIKSICDFTTMPATSVKERIQYSDELLGYVNVVDSHASKRLYYVLDVKGKKLKTIELYEVYSGKKRTVKMWESQFNRIPFEQKNFLMVRKIEKKNKRQPSDQIHPQTGKQIWVDVPNEFEFWLEGYEVDR